MKTRAELSSTSAEGGRRPTPKKWQLLLSTAGMTAIGLAQPILDLLGRNPDFFIARASPDGDVILLALLLGIVIPLSLGALVLLAYSIHSVAGRGLHLAIMGAMGSLVAVNALRYSTIDDAPGIAVISIAVLLGLVVAMGYIHLDWFRSFLHMTGVAPLVVVLAFLLLSPTSRVAWGLDRESDTSSAPVHSPAPVVMVLFDEFSISSIIDNQGRIDAENFPGLSQLASESTWFRNAVGTHEGTRDAIPTILTGVSQTPGEKLPHFADYPSTIFTLVSREYDVNAIETLTQLCPDSVCSEGSRRSHGFRDRWNSLGTDLAIVSGHLFLPSELSEELPPIDQNWGNFAPPPVVRPDNWSIRERLRAQIEDDRRTEVRRFLRQLDHPLQENEFHFIHLPLPHRPWRYMADGRAYVANSGLPGSGGKWDSNSFIVEQAYQRHLIQVQYADHIVGSVIQRLEESGSYDSSVLIVASDHGIAIRPNQRWRSIRQETVGDIAAVPLFIKTPHQRQGWVDDYRAETTDIVPTIAGLLDADIPWEVDGVDLFSTDRPDRSKSAMVGPNGSVEFGVDGDEKLRVARYHSEYFGERGPFGIAPLGYAQLLGESIDVSDSSRALVNATLDFPEMYTDVDVGADPLPIFLSGTLDGPVSAGDVLAVTVDSRVVALTEIWEEDGRQRFYALLPPAELRPGRNEFNFYLAHRKDGQFRLSPVDGA